MMIPQRLFLEQCKDASKSKNLATELSELLGINQDAAYRRMRGDTALSFDEIQRICNHFNVSFDSAISYTGKIVPFQFNSMFGQQYSIKRYLTEIDDQLKMLALSKDEDTNIVLTAMDLPHFRQFAFKALTRFKLFFWQRSVLNLDEYNQLKFDAAEDQEELEQMTARIYQNYHSVASTEIWAPESIDSTIRQVQYYLESGLFVDRESAFQICNDLDDLLNKLENEAQLGKKRILTDEGLLESSFAMYQSDIHISNNCVQAYLNGKVYSYVSFNSFNSLMSFSPHFSMECTKWIEQIRLKSILLSEVSEKLRYQFFKSSRDKVNGLREMV